MSILSPLASASNSFCDSTNLSRLMATRRDRRGRCRYVYRDASGKRCTKFDAVGRSGDGGATWEAMPDPEWTRFGQQCPAVVRYLQETKAENPGFAFAIDESPEWSGYRTRLPKDWNEQDVENFRRGLVAACEADAACN